MNTNIRVLLEVCDELNISYKITSTTGNLVNLLIDNNNYIFVNWTTPLNNHSTSQLCLDKGYFYEFFKNSISMPATQSILDPNCNKNYSNYIENKNISSIVYSISQFFKYPLIIKPNKGCGGLGVYKVADEKCLIKAINNIFDKTNRLYDYIALVQSYIISKHEYRAIFVNSKLIFAYEKRCFKAGFEENLSPLHRDRSKASLVTDKNILNEIQFFSDKLFNKLIIPYCGLDIIVDSKKRYWLIEANGSPSYDFFIHDNGVNDLKNMYSKIILYIKKDNKKIQRTE